MKAQKALRSLAGLGPEVFAIHAFVGMISDQVESLRRQGQSDEEIASVIRSNSAIEISAAEIAAYYASPEDRHHHGGMITVAMLFRSLAELTSTSRSRPPIEPCLSWAT